jgi:hypothetical protein
MIIQVRGESGSGKSTLLRRFREEHGGAEIVETKPFDPPSGNNRRKVDLYLASGDVALLDDEFFGEVGREIVKYYAARYRHVLWESKLGSGEPPQYAFEDGGNEWVDEIRRLGIVWAVLDTDEDTCIANTEEERGGKIKNHSRFRTAHRAVHKIAKKAANVGIRVDTLHYPDLAYYQLHCLLEEGGWVCISPRCSLRGQGSLPDPVVDNGASLVTRVDPADVWG